MSINKAILVDIENLANLYTVQMFSIPDISKATGVSRSTVRLRLLENGVKLRGRTESIRLHPEKLGHLGVKRIFSEEWKHNISLAKKRYGSENAMGVSLKPSGYYEITRGVNKGRPLHDIVIEMKIKRHLKPSEVVHHKNGIKTDNSPNNLEVMTRSEHSKMHLIERNGNETGISHYRHDTHGESHPNAKLTEEDVLKIINDKRNSTALASEYGVKRSCIKKIRTGRTWSYLTNIKRKSL